MHTNGCTKQASTTTAGPAAAGLDFNPNTKTVYVANEFDNTVSVIDAAACNQHQLAGCNQTWKTISLGDSPFPVAINTTTNTIYVGNFGGTFQ